MKTKIYFTWTCRQSFEVKWRQTRLSSVRIPRINFRVSKAFNNWLISQPIKRSRKTGRIGWNISQYILCLAISNAFCVIPFPASFPWHKKLNKKMLNYIFCKHLCNDRMTETESPVFFSLIQKPRIFEWIFSNWMSNALKNLNNTFFNQKFT